MGHHGSHVAGMMMPPPFAPSPFGDLGRMTAQEIMDAKALAASRSHSEAERRRRERINAHLARLRSLLPNTTKTDKASLLAEVIQHVKELKRQTSEITEEACPLPTESDELTVDASTGTDGDGEQQEEAMQAPMSPQHTVASIQDALRAVMERTASATEESGGSGAGGGLKRQRTTSLSAILENRSI
uniref:BHLH domain-containing protein n=1 Tax=Oryza barthii TaxID=65489 RepID=A0A0D3FGG9_9ORYZ